MAMKLLSNLVREEGEDTFRSKNVIPVTGVVTTRLKQDWKLNDTWNELIRPRFERLNNLTNSNLFGEIEKINGHDVFINRVPEELRKNFDKKRIDHRHHAMDALAIALITENHVNYLNNISAQDTKEKKLDERYDIKGKYMTSKKHEDGEKSKFFLPPAQYKKDGQIIGYSYQFRDVKSGVFKDIALEALQNTIVSFKQKKRIIKQRSNKIQRWNEDKGKLDLVSQSGLNKKENYNVRQALHDVTFYGRTNLYYKTLIMPIEKAIKEDFIVFDFNVRKEIGVLKEMGKGISEIISVLSPKYNDVRVYDKYIASRYKGELENFSRVPSNNIEEKLRSITDTAIQKIIFNHIENYIETDEKGKISYNIEKAFSYEGIFEMNKNIEILNEGKKHKHIYKIRTAGKQGNAFSVSENNLKSSHIVKTAGDSNFYCGVYRKGIERKFYIPTLRESVESLKQGYEPCPNRHPKDLDFELDFVLNPSDLVYVPTEDERQNPFKVDYKNLTKDQKERIYKFRDASENNKGGIQINFMPHSWASMIFKKSKEESKIYLNNEKELQGEVTLTSDKDKSQNSIDGIQIRSFCWKLNIDRLGNIKPA